MTITATDTMPAYSLARVLALRDQLAGRIPLQFADMTLDAGDVDMLAYQLCAHITDAKQHAGLTQTAHMLLGRTLSVAQLRALCWRIAGNAPALIAGHAITDWRAPGQPEWVPAQVLSVLPVPAQKSEPHYRLQCRALAGNACTEVLERVFSSRWLAKLSRAVGFTKSRGPRPYQSPYQFATLRLYAWLDPTQSRYGRPYMSEFRFPSACLTFNQQALNLRCRNGIVCPRNFTHQCHLCAVGYLQCPGGTHRENYLPIVCSVCRQESMADPEHSAAVCVYCWRQQQINPTL